MAVSPKWSPGPSVATTRTLSLRPGGAYAAGVEEEGAAMAEMRRALATETAEEDEVEAVAEEEAVAAVEEEEEAAASEDRLSSTGVVSVGIASPVARAGIPGSYSHWTVPPVMM